jgi:hypothetical protein
MDKIEKVYEDHLYKNYQEQVVEEKDLVEIC